jgi:plastocyanin
MGVSAVLVLLAVAMAVVTAGGESKASAQSSGTQSQASAETPAPPSSQPGASSQPTATTGTPAPPSSQPTATTGTPAPPSSPAAGKATKLALATDPGGQLAYDKKSLTAKAGTVTIALANSSPVEHDVTVAQGATVLGHTPTFVGGTKTVTLSLKPGTYTFYCSVPGHRQAGMEGTLTVGS